MSEFYEFVKKYINDKAKETTGQRIFYTRTVGKAPDTNFLGILKTNTKYVSSKGDPYNAIVSGTPDPIEGAIQLNSNTVYVPHETRGRAFYDGAIKVFLALIGGCTSPNTLGTNPSEFAIMKLNTGDTFRLPFDSGISIFTNFTNPAVANVNTNGHTGYGGWYYGQLSSDRSKLAIVRIVLNNRSSINSVTKAPYPPSAQIYWAEYRGITLNTLTNLIDYVSVNHGSASLAYPDTIRNKAYLDANVADPLYTFLSSTAAHASNFDFEPVIAWDNSGNFSFDIIGFTRSRYTADYIHVITVKQATAMLGHLIYATNIQAGGGITLDHQFLEDRWDNVIINQTIGELVIPEDSLGFIQSGQSGWSPPLCGSSTSGGEGAKGNLAFKNSLGVTASLLTSTPNPPIQRYYSSPYGTIVSGDIVSTDVAMVDTLRYYPIDFLWIDLPTFGGPANGFLKIVADESFSALRYTLSGPNFIPEITAYSYDSIGMTISSGETFLGNAISYPPAGFTTSFAIMDWR